MADIIIDDNCITFDVIKHVTIEAIAREIPKVLKLGLTAKAKIGSINITPKLKEPPLIM